MSAAGPRTTPEPGTVLVAVPVLHDPNFYRTVVLVCDHNEEGSFGLVLNRETDLAPEQLMEELAAVGENVRLGGPVQPNTLHYLHTFREIEAAVELADGLFWGGDFEEIHEVLGAGDGSIRLFLGYSGWGEGQLESEIEEGSWAVCPIRPSWVFETPPDDVWSSVMRAMGGDWALMANFPDDPRLN